jgi:hypothetical protein
MSSVAYDTQTQQLKVPLVTVKDGAVLCQDKQLAVCYVWRHNFEGGLTTASGRSCADFVAPLDGPDDEAVIALLSELCKLVKINFKRDRVTLEQLQTADVVFVAGTALPLLELTKVHHLSGP